MQLLKRFLNSTAGRAAALAAITTLTLSGCLGGCIPPISFSATLLNNVSLPQEIILLGAGTNIDVTTDLPQGVCNFPTQEQLQQMVSTYVPSFLVNLIKVDSATIDRVRLTASQGNFNDFTFVGLTLLQGDTRLPLGQASSSSGLGTSFQLQPDVPLDMLDFLLNRAPGECLNAEVSIIGKVPQNTLTFSLAADMTVTISLGF